MSVDWSDFKTSVWTDVVDASDLRLRFAASLADRALFVRHDTPPPVGTLVAVEFRLPTGNFLCRLGGRVVHARPATAPGEKNAGLEIEILKLDAITEALATDFRRQNPPPAETTPKAPASKAEA